MKIRLIITLILGIIYQTHAAQGQETSTQPTPTQKLYQLSTPVKVFREWDISDEVLAENPQFNTSDYKIIEQAIKDGYIDGMSTHIVKYEFANDGKVNDWVELYSHQTPQRVTVNGLPGVFKVEFEDGMPTKFTLDQEAFQNALDEGLLFLDCYDNGLEYFTITYDEKGFPSELSGQSMDFFGGKQYNESYSKYMIDRNGNWINRIVYTPYETKKQYRSYEY
ncbi:MAG: hypothetical protein HDR94_02795 [Bacteroides sp.]|nr:hypothetical protein [Bacteroides sp.]